MTDPRAPINLNELAAKHDWSMDNLRDLLIHIADFALNELPHPSVKSRAITAMAYAAKEIAIQAAAEAEQLNVEGNMNGFSLMAIANAGTESESDAQPDQSPAYLSPEQIDTCARSLSAGLDGYLRAALAHLADEPSPGIDDAQPPPRDSPSFNGLGCRCRVPPYR